MCKQYLDTQATTLIVLVLFCIPHTKLNIWMMLCNLKIWCCIHPWHFARLGHYFAYTSYILQLLAILDMYKFRCIPGGFMLSSCNPNIFWCIGNNLCTLALPCTLTHTIVPTEHYFAWCSHIVHGCKHNLHANTTYCMY
jgi:hypothetical protein